MNRFQIADNVPFRTSFEAALEKYFSNEQPTLYAAVAYGYLSDDGTDPHGATDGSNLDGYLGEESLQALPFVGPRFYCVRPTAVIIAISSGMCRGQAQRFASAVTDLLFHVFSCIVLRRRSVSIGREGLYYVFVLTFIVGGATLRDVNLLFVLAGMMIGPLLFNWRLVVQTARSLEVRRRFPDQVFAGRPFRVEVRGHNHHWRMAGWTMVVEDPIERGLDDLGRLSNEKPKAPETHGTVVLPFIAAGESAVGSYGLTLPRRGRYRFGPFRVFTRFPLGLVKASAKQGRRQSLIVCPRIGELKPFWLELVDAETFGRHQTHCRQGPIDGDYYGLREWRPGDSRRWIHWRTTARLGRLAVRQFEQQQNRDVVIVLDLWQPEHPTDDDRGRSEYAVSLAATMVEDLARRGSARLSLAVSAEDRGIWSGTLSGVLVQQIMEGLALVQACSDERLDEVLSEAVTSLRHGARLLVISTRGNRLNRVLEERQLLQKPRLRRTVERIVWLDVNGSRVGDIFSLN